MESKKYVSVIIVTWNNEGDIFDCLQGVLAQDYKNYKVLVVDNNSSDSTVEVVKKNFPSVEVAQMPKNLYLVRANNWGIRHMREKYGSEFSLVLNPDTTVPENLISTLVESINSEPKVGAVGPKVKFLLGQDAGKINSAGLIYDGKFQAYDRGFREVDSGKYDKVEEVFGVTGACILFRNQMLDEIGLYWERIKMHLDEVELFIRANNHGWKVLYDGRISIGHKWMVSTNKNKAYKMELSKKKVWFYIALRHYPILSKLAALKQYFQARLTNA